MPELAVDELTIAYEEAGSGPPLLLLHGGFSDHRAWRHQLGGLSERYHVIAWDTPGCGGSSTPPSSFRLPDHADCLAGLVSGLGLDRPHVLGLSFGGGLALEFFRRHPHLPRSLILAPAYARWAGSLPPDEVEARLARALADRDRPAEEWVSDYLPTFFSDAVSQEVLDDTVGMMLDTRPEGMEPMLRAFAEADLREVLADIHVPTLLLYGTADVRSPMAVAEDLHARIPTSRLILMDGVGHSSNLEAPERFNSEVRRFLDSIEDEPQRPETANR